MGRTCRIPFHSDGHVSLKAHLLRSKRGREGHSVEGPVPQDTVTPDPLADAASLPGCSWSDGVSGTSGWDPAPFHTGLSSAWRFLVACASIQ